MNERAMPKDDRTWGQWIRGEWWWRVSRHLTSDALSRRAAWWVPRRIALWVFIRVYTATVREAPGDEFKRVYDGWEAGNGR